MASKPKSKPKTAAQMDKEFQEMLDDMKEKNKDYKFEGLTAETAEEYFSTHPAFINKQVTEEDIERSSWLQGLQNLQYEDEDETQESKALAYKDDGNWHFKHRLYQKAVRAYSEGLRKKCSDKSLNCTLYSNRAAANFYLENYASAIKDSLEAMKLEPNRSKSLMRCAKCSEALEKYDDAIEWSRKILQSEPGDAQAKEILTRCQKNKKLSERDKRKKEKREKLKQRKLQALVDVVRERGIKLNLTQIKHKASEGEEVLSLEDMLVLSSIDDSNPASAKVHFEDDEVENLAQDGRLVWPVLFTYPEYQVSEIIEKFHEDTTFIDHIEVMFQDKAPWDAGNCYTLSQIEIYHETDSGRSVCRVPVDSTLRTVLCSGKITVSAGTPTFIVLSSGSSFREQFTSKYV